MKQLCYLAPPGKEGQFDALFEELDIVAITYTTAQIKSLTAFITREKTVNQQNFLLFDLTQAEYSPEHILSAVQLLRRFSVARLIFIAPMGDATDLLYGHLAAFRVTDLIRAEEKTDLQAAMRGCLTGATDYHNRLDAVQNAMATTAKTTVAPFSIPAGLVVTLAVAGTQPRIGTTTQVFALFHYLKSLGFHPAILDASGAFAALLHNLYGDQATDNEDGFTFKGIPFSAAINEHFNAYITDVGVLTPETAPQFSAGDCAILVGGAKPWELPALAAARQLLDDVPPKHLVTLISSATERDMDTLGKYLGNHAGMAPYHPDLWEPAPAAVYRETVLPCLQSICGGGATEDD